MKNPFETILRDYWEGSLTGADFAEAAEKLVPHGWPAAQVLPLYLRAVINEAARQHKTRQPGETLEPRLQRLLHLLSDGETANAYRPILFQRPPAELLAFIESFSADDGALPLPYHPTFELQLGLTGASETVSFRYDAKPLADTEQDPYLRRHMPINGDVSVCMYDGYLPLYRLLLRYAPQTAVLLGTEVPAPYVYVVSFRHLAGHAPGQGLDFIPAEVWQDLREDRAILVLNDTHECTEYAPYFPNYERFFRNRGVTRNVFLLSGNTANREAYQEFVSNKHKIPKWLCRLTGRKQDLAISFFAFRFFEEAVAENQRTFFAAYDFEHRLRLLTDSGDRLLHFLCLNRMVKDYRVVASYLFFRHGLLKQTAISQDGFADERDFRFGHNRNKALFGLTEPAGFQAFRESLPWQVDTGDFTPNLWNVVPLDAVNRCLVWVVTETEFSDGPASHSFLSEKTYKPIAFFMPFILIGNPYTLRTLRNEGYRTFSRWWDESYDDEPDPVRRMEKIFRVITELGRLSPSELLDLVKEMRETLEHNHRRLLSADAGKTAMEAIRDRYARLRPVTG